MRNHTRKPLHRGAPRPERMLELAIDCSNCCGLCCVALYFAKSEGFPKDKAPGKPCQHLQADFRCALHGELKAKGLHGCMAYDCFGAGQKTTQVLYGGGSWRDPQIDAEQMFKAYLKLYQIHQMLWYLLEAERLVPAEPLWPAISSLIEEGRGYTLGTPETVQSLDVEAYKRRVVPALQEAGALVQREVLGEAVENHRSDYLGCSMRGQDLTGNDFSMSLLIAADLRGCMLYGANLLGADLRDANLCGADLRESLFLTQGQINAARGDKMTRLPAGLAPPSAWK